MRLLHRDKGGNLSLTRDFPNNHEIPPYAILSHMQIVKTLSPKEIARIVAIAPGKDPSLLRHVLTTNQPRIRDRFEIALKLVRLVLQYYLSPWLPPKGWNISQILLIPALDNKQESFSLDLKARLLTRPTNEVYRPPEQPINGNYTLIHLAKALAEIGRWQPIHRELEDNWVSIGDLETTMGYRYYQCIRKCLSGGHRFLDSGAITSEEALLQAVHEEIVLAMEETLVNMESSVAYRHI